MVDVSTLFVAINARGAVNGAKQVVRAMKDMTGAARKTAGGVGGLGSSFRKLFAIVGGGLVLRKMVGTLTAFEDAMGQLQGVTRATQEEMKLFSETARNLGATTRFTAGEAANALVSLSRAGFDVAESVAAVGATLDLATGQMLELGEATKFVASSIRQFGLEATDAERVADILTNTANSAATDVRELASAMSFGGVAARAVGVSIEETAAIMGVLSDSAIRGTRAGMGVRSMMTRLVAPTAAAEAAIKKLGLRLEDVNPQAVGITTALQNLKDANIDVAEAVAIFGQRQFVAALAAVENIEKIKELTAANMAAAGSSRIAADIMENTLSGALKELKSAMEEATLSAGDKGFLGTLKEITRFTTDLIRALSGVKTGASKTFKDMNLVVLKAVKFWGSFFAGLKAGWSLTWETIKNIATGIKGVFSGSINAIVKAFGFMFDAIGKGLAAILTEGANIARFFDQDLNEALLNMRSSVKETRLEMSELFDDLELPEPEFRAMSDIWGEVAETMKADIAAINAAYVVQRREIVQNWNEQGRVKQEVEQTKKAIEDNTKATKQASEAASGLKTMWGLVTGSVGQTATKVMNSFMNMGRTASNAVKNVANQFGDAKKKADGFKVTMEDIAGASVGIFSDLVRGTTTFKDAIADATDAIIDMAIRMAIMSAFAPSPVIPGGGAAAVGARGAKGLVAMQSGSIVRGPTEALIGEGHRPEAVIPLDKGPDGVLGLKGGGVTNNTYLSFRGDAKGMMAQMGDPRTVQIMRQRWEQGYSL